MDHARELAFRQAPVDCSKPLGPPVTQKLRRPPPSMERHWPVM
jgi:hypothetical protein